MTLYALDTDHLSLILRGHPKMANNGILVTRNYSDFSKVPGLTLDDWTT